MAWRGLPSPNPCLACPVTGGVWSCQNVWHLEGRGMSCDWGRAANMPGRSGERLGWRGGGGTGSNAWHFEGGVPTGGRNAWQVFITGCDWHWQRLRLRVKRLCGRFTFPSAPTAMNPSCFLGVLVLLVHGTVQGQSEPLKGQGGWVTFKLTLTSQVGGFDGADSKVVNDEPDNLKEQYEAYQGFDD